MTKKLKPVSSNGWLTSVANMDLVETIFPSAFTVKNLYTFSIAVSDDCLITINNSQKIFIDRRLGLNLTTDFEPITSLKFDISGVNYYFLAGY